MPLVSTFELLVKPIAPPATNLPQPIVAQIDKVARRVVQGYFLTIANTTNSLAALRLEFTAITPELNLKDTVIVFDVIGKNEFADLKPVPNEPKRFTFDFRIPAHDTALVTLLPDLSNLELFEGVRNLEIRGYVNISRLGFRGPTYDLLITPEQRGTFLPKDLNQNILDFDQIAYALPTASGGSFLSLKPLSFPVSPGDLIPVPLGDNSSLTSDRQELLDLMFERLDKLE
ncbi:hypothetical protein [Nodularia sp. NIES-3585]|uniref:hypothetical protein n=1 Tax=Nodularia sp. NIES-3585 TaxID=1973477 RepID=UPI000B5C27AA|nr:hypothetical protein [Nodularia sp. NIES-3585]GAX37139.1 hypothetical protein NIES3585_31800 [Nodularia sp. NIES-3585]